MSTADSPALRERTDALLRISPQEWGAFDVHSDPADKWLKSGDAERAVSAALTSGCTAAHQAAQRYGTVKPRVLAAQMEIELSYFSKELQCNYLLLAYYRSKPPEICINTELTDRMEPLISKCGINLRGYTAEDVLIAHELYHHLENAGGGATMPKPRFPSWRLGKIQFYTYVAAVSEVAAFAFAQELLELSFFPQAVEFLAVQMCDQAFAENYWKLLTRGKTLSPQTGEE